MKKILSFLFILFVIAAPNTYAENTHNDYLSTPTSGEQSDSETYGEGNIRYEIKNFSSQASYKHLKDGYSYIENNGNGTVHVSGYTSSYSSSDVIGITLYLQRWDSSRGQWVDVANLGDTSRPNTSFVATGKDVTIVKGYYYRTRAVHWVTKSGVLEKANSLTTYIHIK